MVAAAALVEHGKEEEGGDEAVGLLGGYLCQKMLRTWLLCKINLRHFLLGLG
jgi:hypothetical protein